MKYIVTEIETMNDRLFIVRRVGRPSWEKVHVNVWNNGASVGCCSCFGILSAMLSTCPHANAVKRHLRKEKT